MICIVITIHIVRYSCQKFQSSLLAVCTLPRPVNCVAYFYGKAALTLVMKYTFLTIAVLFSRHICYGICSCKGHLFRVNGAREKESLPEVTHQFQKRSAEIYVTQIPATLGRFTPDNSRLWGGYKGLGSLV